MPVLLAAMALATAGCGGDGGGDRDRGGPPTTAAPTTADRTATTATSPRSPTTATAREAVRRLPVAVDRRVELLSILFRLAGAPPYPQAATPYARAVDGWFGRWRDDPAVAATRALVAGGIAYDGPIQLAVQLDDRGRLAVPRADLDPRWRSVDVARYLTLVRRFARRADLDGFLRGQRDYAAAVVDADRRRLADRPILDWYERLLGRRPGARYAVAPGLLSGGHSFSARGHEGQAVLLVLFLEAPDAAGVPRPTDASVEFLAHELAHSWVNPIVAAATGRLRPAAEPAFRRVAEAMRRQAYPTPRIMVEEAVVRALTVLFLRDRVGADAAARSLAEQQRLGFAWTPALVDALDRLRRADGGRLDPDAAVAATARVLRAWTAG
ncbi:DUF4932 domain-containing protein [Patulibacter defluvii]|uniref:DUF4932 domain-containing protein n=1 Tax=Patulibacter defluvii TaxID=3095358 RepID=UPI002A76375E|nr:DUF4932 domain-containing protein [Patulibacter sp. DM4]